jgi:hypothetical protein
LLALRERARLLVQRSTRTDRAMRLSERETASVSSSRRTGAAKAC